MDVPDSIRGKLLEAGALRSRAATLEAQAIELERLALEQSREGSHNDR